MTFDLSDIPTDVPTYTLTADAIYDLIASGFGIGASMVLSGIEVASDRDSIVAEIKEYFPAYAIQVTVDFSNAGRPIERQIEFMERDVTLSEQNGDHERAAALRGGINDMKCGKEL